MGRSFSSNAGTVFVVTLILCLLVNYFGSIFLFLELRMALGTDVLIASAAALLSHLRALSRYITQLEHRITVLELNTPNHY